jgi:hypothetical protein
MNDHNKQDDNKPAVAPSGFNAVLGVTDPKRTYLVVASGDGYETHIVTGDKLEDTYLQMLFGDETQYPDDCSRDELLTDLRDDDGHWESNWYHGPTKYRENLEDGFVEVILMTPNPQRLNSATARFCAVRWNDGIESERIREV